MINAIVLMTFAIFGVKAIKTGLQSSGWR